MENATFIAIQRKVNLAFCIVAALITVGLIFSTIATAKSMTGTEYSFIENNIAVEFNEAKLRCNTVTSVAFDKCVADAESIRNASKLELDAQRKAMVGTKHESRSSGNTAKLNSHSNIKSNNTNTMPVMDELTPAFKKTRLI